MKLIVLQQEQYEELETIVNAGVQHVCFVNAARTDGLNARVKLFDPVASEATGPGTDSGVGQEPGPSRRRARTDDYEFPSSIPPTFNPDATYTPAGAELQELSSSGNAYHDLSTYRNERPVQVDNMESFLEVVARQRYCLLSLLYDQPHAVHQDAKDCIFLRRRCLRCFGKNHGVKNCIVRRPQLPLRVCYKCWLLHSPNQPCSRLCLDMLPLMAWAIYHLIVVPSRKAYNNTCNPAFMARATFVPTTILDEDDFGIWSVIPSGSGLLNFMNLVVRYMD